MTPQEIFETVSKHLFNQGIISSFDDAFGRSRCFYRAYTRDRNSGQVKLVKCAVGCLISDEDYRPEMDSKIDPRTNGFMESSIDNGMGVDNIIKHYDHLPKWMADNIVLLTNLQDTHDYKVNWISDENMKIALKKVAKDHSLNHEFLENLTFNR